MTLVEALREHREIADSIYQACTTMPAVVAEEMLQAYEDQAEVNLAALQTCDSMDAAPHLAAVLEAFALLQGTAYDFLIHPLLGERADLLVGRDRDWGVITFATAWKRHQEATAALLCNAQPAV
jgi:hypothetical protein